MFQAKKNREILQHWL